jgi:hypothetical protein
LIKDLEIGFDEMDCFDFFLQKKKNQNNPFHQNLFPKSEHPLTQKERVI